MAPAPQDVDSFLPLADGVAPVLYLARADERRTPLFVSANAEQVLGLSADAWIAEPELFWTALHPFDRARIERELAVWNRAAPLQLRYRLAAPDGRQLHFQETCLFDGSGAEPRLRGLIADATELEVLRGLVSAGAGAVDPPSLGPFGDLLPGPLALGWTAFVDLATGEGVAFKYGPFAERLAEARVRAKAFGPLATKAEGQSGLAATASGSWAELPDALQALGLGEASFAFCACVPGSEGHRARGFFFGGGRRARALDPREERLVRALAEQVALWLRPRELARELEGIGLERQRLAGSVLLAHEDERRRIATELHDGAGQTLMAAVIQTDLALRLAAGQPQMARILSLAREQLATTLEELRGLAHALRPATLDNLGLPEALQEMARSFSGALELSIDAAPAPFPLEPEMATAIFRIAQAALTNVARHAQAKWAALRLEVDEAKDRVVLEIEDDGRGVEQRRLVEGLGLVAMRERAQGVGGTLVVESREGGGTRVRAVIPLGRRRG